MNEPQWPESEPNDGAILMPLGGLIALLCGGCTWAQMRWQDPAAALGLLVGGPLTIVGLVMFAIGLFRFVRSRTR